jgi:hypothetical protein
MGFGGLVTASAVVRLMGHGDASDLLRWINLPFAVFASGYTAFLFWQCRGRDLWLGRDLFPHLLLMASLCGAGVALFMPREAGGAFDPEALFVILAALNGGWIALARAFGQKTRDGHRAHALLYGSGEPRLASLLFYVAALVVLFLPRVPASPGMVLLVCCVASFLVVAGLLVFERAWVRAGQEVPLS